MSKRKMKKDPFLRNRIRFDSSRYPYYRENGCRKWRFDSSRYKSGLIAPATLIIEMFSRKWKTVLSGKMGAELTRLWPPTVHISDHQKGTRLDTSHVWNGSRTDDGMTSNSSNIGPSKNNQRRTSHPFSGSRTDDEMTSNSSNIGPSKNNQRRTSHPFSGSRNDLKH